ncbi:MAG: 2Fe-2S iron-sulfur cluster binding domain-containing protein [Saprospiraceae bacterium]|jgi:2Fe-2S ferredoxin|nr:2Fe-2S iron-sulfur cluster binding domain-containing protein [Saprospiraceae bacterium]MBV6472869.1 Na(+)-translocating NADH-quinone reductase subunit F [Saprospiraceae bacterium]
MARINYQFEDPAMLPRSVEHPCLGKSLLEVTEECGIHLSSNCGGVCACSTCHVYVHGGGEYLEEISDKEEDFIDRAINPKLESRLACQCIVLDDRAVIDVTIPDQRRIIGHEH